MTRARRGANFFGRIRRDCSNGLFWDLDALKFLVVVPARLKVAELSLNADVLLPIVESGVVQCDFKL